MQAVTVSPGDQTLDKETEIEATFTRKPRHLSATLYKKRLGLDRASLDVARNDIQHGCHLSKHAQRTHIRIKYDGRP